MPSAGGFVKGAAGGAGIGEIFGGVGAAVGAGVGGLLSLFDPSEEEIATKRKNELLKAIAQMRYQAILHGAETIGKQTTANAAAERQAAAARALSLGHSADAESFILPAVSRVNTAGSEALSRYNLGVESNFDNAEIAAQANYADRPIQPGISDYLAEIGGSALAFKQNLDYINTLAGPPQISPSQPDLLPTPSSPVGSPPPLDQLLGAQKPMPAYNIPGLPVLPPTQLNPDNLSERYLGGARDRLSAFSSVYGRKF